MAIHELVLGYVAAGDHRLMYKVNRWTPPRWLRLWMIWATRAGDGWLWYAAGLGVLLLGGAERWAALGAGASAAALGIVLFECLKRVTDSVQIADRTELKRRHFGVEELPACQLELTWSSAQEGPAGATRSATGDRREFMECKPNCNNPRTLRW
jgi:hypothetical protein